MRGPNDFKHVIQASVFILLFSLNGCGASSSLSTVEGAVNVNGKPVNSGTVSFSPINGGKAVTTEIRDGRYRATNVARGENLVHLNSYQPTGGTFVEFGIEYPEEKNVIPQKYERGIELSVEQPILSHDFELSSK